MTSPTGTSPTETSPTETSSTGYTTYRASDGTTPVWPGPQTPPHADLVRVLEAMRRYALPDSATMAERDAQLVAATANVTVPEGHEVRAVRLGGLDAEIVGTPAQLARPRRVLHLHGGGYVLGSPATTRAVAAGLSLATDTAVASLDYRLAPAAPFPAALDDAVSAFRALADEAGDARLVAISGDSAGGGLALATAMRLRDTGGERPAAVIGLSPWLDLALAGGPADAAQRVDPQVTPTLLALFSDAYLGSADPHDPAASPLYGDLTGLPPVLAQAGTHEYLREDARRLLEAARAQGADVTVDVFDGMIHVWHALAPRLAGARGALERVGAWLRDVAPAFRASA
ncbi:alpha/beta hydrolase [Microbacterium sp. No. 7]|uniref:alpha/beta hydrolase n=1 Tax=Microbacterium sp. No. 7 TaxID=1714373 RepID=UPI0006D1EF49|nr:alpha/beta hydrolase [Microbacterium sp. No. 7]ALJ19237.1 hypothetical protein AOA12_04705 [Microbacterium sp. No. 7]